MWRPTSVLEQGSYHPQKQNAGKCVPQYGGRGVDCCMQSSAIMLFSMQVLEEIGLCVRKPMVLQVDCKDPLDLTYGWSVRRLMKHVSVHACFLHELKEANLLLCVWLPTDANMVDMYTKNVSPCLYHHHQCTIMDDENDDDMECHQYLCKILITITKSPGEGV